jgi:putative SOS response-associated peptidase YedK
VCGYFEIQGFESGVYGKLRKRYGLTLDDSNPKIEARPTDPLPIVTADETGDWQLRTMHWGIRPVWTQQKGGRPIINARAETLLEKRTWSSALQSRRCIIPMTSYIEGSKPPKGSGRRTFELTSAEAFSCAGIWEEQVDSHGQLIEAFTMITTPANQLVLPYHGRMPAMLEADSEDAWLDPDAAPDDLLQVLAPFSPQMMREVPEEQEQLALL